MELRIRLSMRCTGENPHGKLECGQCGSDKNWVLYEGDVCGNCWTGYDLASHTPLIVTRTRKKAKQLIAAGITSARQIADHVRYSPARVSQWLCGYDDSIFMTEAIGNHLITLGAAS